jgi:hypothetical protein
MREMRELLKRRCRRLVVAVILLAGLPGTVRAQQMGNLAMPAGLGGPATPSGQLFGVSPANPQGSGDPSLSINDTYVGFIDSAVPRNVIGLRFDADFNNRQPTRATYLFAKGGVPNSVGFPLPETRVDADEMTSYAEFGVASWFSIFMEAPYRWINPEVNANQSGPGDMRYGLKICTWSDENIIATILLRVYQPTARNATLGTGHWSLEPGLLAAYRISPSWHLEGEFRYWIPLSSDDFAGNILRYGLGLSWGQRQPAGVWYAPVVECIGWTVLSGKTMLASSPDDFVIQDARNQTIVNAYLGLRFGYGQNVDMFLGYGRAVTGEYWARDNFRFEVRLSY